MLWFLLTYLGACESQEWIWHLRDLRYLPVPHPLCRYKYRYKSIVQETDKRRRCICCFTKPCATLLRKKTTCAPMTLYICLIRRKTRLSWKLFQIRCVYAQAAFDMCAFSRPRFLNRSESFVFNIRFNIHISQPVSPQHTVQLEMPF